MNVRAQGSSAVRQIEHWYRECIDDFVQEGCAKAADATPEQPGAITGPVLAYAHEQAWRHGIVRAAKASDPHDWAAMTVAHEGAAYEHLLGWTAGKYGVPEDDVRGSQTRQGYRHHER